MATIERPLPGSNALFQTAPPGRSGTQIPKGRNKRTVLFILMASGCLAGLVWFLLLRRPGTSGSGPIPTAVVQLGDVTVSINAKGELRGGNPQELTAPMTGGSDMHITHLLATGQPVKVGDTVVQFDTAEQVFKLAEAIADIAEAEQNLIKATAQRGADDEEDRYALEKAETDVRLAELDVRKNQLLPAITARENDLALEGARDHLRQVQNNRNNRQATGAAGIQIQEAARVKAQAQSETAQANIKAMTLRADRAGYVAVKENTNTNMAYDGMVLPIFQEGDTVRPGMAVAEIPDLNRWEVVANIGELDQGHLKTGQNVSLTVFAQPGRTYRGSIQELGGLTGPFWNRRFECKASLDNPSPDLRPGMSAVVSVLTDQMRNVLSVPSQALFEADGRTFVYVQTGETFSQRSVKLLRRSETRAVITGVGQGQVVALANPAEMAKKQNAGASPLNSVGR